MISTATNPRPSTDRNSKPITVAHHYFVADGGFALEAVRQWQAEKLRSLQRATLMAARFGAVGFTYWETLDGFRYSSETAPYLQRSAHWKLKTGHPVEDQVWEPTKTLPGTRLRREMELVTFPTHFRFCELIGINPSYSLQTKKIRYPDFVSFVSHVSTTIIRVPKTNLATEGVPVLPGARQISYQEFMEISNNHREARAGSELDLPF